ncbi:MAG: hypothetical protein ACEQSH_00540 [Bacteroidia bacterium]
MAVSRKADLERLALAILALLAWVLAPIVAIVMWAAGGVLAKQRAAQAADAADRTLNALTGNPIGVWLSQGAANNTGPGWRVLAALLEAGWPGHIEQFKQGS